tara:strand:- start:55 stop:258 length:204 start_codon:yes stop_codon:yes gene_type:complete
MADYTFKVENAKWHTDLQGNNIAINCTKNGQPMVHIPIDESNADYQEVKKMIDAKDITIGEADKIVS